MIGRLTASGARFVAATDPVEASIAQAMINSDPLGAKVQVEPNAEGRSIITKFEPL